MTLCGSWIGPKNTTRGLVTNSLIEAWHGNEVRTVGVAYRKRCAPSKRRSPQQDFDVVAPLVGEAIALIHEVRPAADIVRDMARDATRILNRAEAPHLVQG